MPSYNPARRLFGGDSNNGSEGNQESGATLKSKKQSSRNSHTAIGSSNSINGSSSAYASGNVNGSNANSSNNYTVNGAATSKHNNNSNTTSNVGSVGRSARHPSNASNASSAMSGSNGVSTLGGATSVESITHGNNGTKNQTVGKQQASPTRVETHNFDSSRPGTGNEEFVTAREQQSASGRATDGGQQGQSYTSSGPQQQVSNDSNDDIRRSNDEQGADKTGSDGNVKASQNSASGLMTRSNTGDMNKTGRGDSTAAADGSNHGGGQPKSKPPAYATSEDRDRGDEEGGQSTRNSKGEGGHHGSGCEGRHGNGGGGGGGTLDGKGLQALKEGSNTNAKSGDNRSGNPARGRSSDEDNVGPSLSRTTTSTTAHKAEPIAQAGDFADKDAKHVFLSAALGNGTNRQPVTRFRIHTANLQVHCAALMELASGGKQEVQLEEDAATLKLLFGLMYNMPSPELSEHDWQVVLRLARCAHRFDVARAKEVAAAYFTEQEQVGTLSPFMTFAFAIKYKMQKLEEAAAERSVRFDTGRLPELVFNMMGFNAFQRLVAFHNRRQAFYQDTLNNISIDPKDLADQCYQTGGICVVAPLSRLKCKLAWPSQTERDGTKQTTPDNASLLRQLVSEIGLIDCGTCSRALCEAALEMQIALECLPRYSERNAEGQQAGR